MNTSDNRVFSAEICELMPGRLFQLGTVVSLSLLCSSVICSSDRIILCITSLSIYLEVQCAFRVDAGSRMVMKCA